MNLFAMINIFIAVLCLSLTAVIFKYAKNSTHRIWVFFNLILTTWGVSSFLIGIASNEAQARFYWELAFVAIGFMPALFYHFVLSFCNRSQRTLLILSYLYAVFFSIVLSLGLATHSFSMLMSNSIYFINANLVFSLMMGSWCGLVVLGFVEFFNYLKGTTGLPRIQSQFMFWSMLIGFSGGVSTALPAYGLKFYPVFQISVVFYVIFNSYAIFKHGLIPLDIIIKRSIFYSSLVTIVTILYFVGVLIFQRIFIGIIGNNNMSGTVVSLVVIAIIFIPIKNRIQAIVDKIILKNSPIEIVVQNENLRDEVIKTEKFKSIADLASMLAHEIKNPLSNLAMLTEELNERKNEPGYIEEYQRLVIKEIERITSLLRELLVFANPTQLTITDINPNKIIEQVINLIKSKCDHTKIEIIRSFNTNSNVPGDSNLLKQAILNLVFNAIDAMSHGGVLTISTETRESPILYNNYENGTRKTQYVMSISDTGCGIDSKDLPFVFDPFFTRKTNGTGLGLPITQSIIEKHGGKIEVASTVNVGTNFKIIL